MSEREFCPYFQQAVELLGRRYCGAVARALLDRPLRFSELERSIPGISARMLTVRLRELESEGLVAHDGAYSLTLKGEALVGVVDAIEHWAHEWLERAHA